MIEIFLVFLLLIFNYAVSVYNAYSVGYHWAQMESLGGLYGKIVLWSGWIMSAVGFTWCYMLIIGFVMYALHWIDKEAVNAMFSLGYLIIIIPALGSGFVIWASSVIIAYKERKLSNIVIATYNTSAQFYNSYRALSAIPEAFKNAAEFFAKSGSGGGGKNKDKGLIIAALIMAIVLGILTTKWVADWGADNAESSVRKRRYKNMPD